MDRKEWPAVSKVEPCVICGKPDWCRRSADGAVALCGRVSEGSFQEAKSGGGWLHRLKENPKPTSNGHARHATPMRETPPAAPERNWKAEGDKLRGAMSEAHLAKLAEVTGVLASAWAALSPGWASGDDLRNLRASGAGWAEDFPAGAWVFTEHSGEGRIVGLSLRAGDGRKGAPGGCKRGLIVPSNLHRLPDPVLLVEGASDVAACVALGLAAVGRPSNRGGAEDAAVLLDGRAVLVVGERDAKADGAWPGRDGAKAVAQQLAGRWGEPVSWTLPPLNVKDVRAWLLAKLAAGLDAGDAAAMQAAGVELLTELRAAAKPVKPERRTQADALVDLAKANYRLGMSEDGEAFAVPVDGPAVAMMFRGGASGLRAALAKAFRQKTGRTPSASALADALVALEGMAQDATPEPVALRVAATEGGIVLDLGDATGRAVVATPGGWAVQAVSPVLFRRTALTSPLPEPVPAEPADLLQLRELLNVDDDTWRGVVGWAVAALLPTIPHAVLLLGGEQGTGKSTAARLILGLVDPSSALLRSEPRDAEQWAITAAGSWAVCLDNVSHIGGWLSDALCKAVTGDGLVRRKLYTDSDLAVLSFRRCIVLTSIDAGALRGDLGDRLLLADLEAIPDNRRRTETELDAVYCDLRPRLLGALLTAAARTLAALPRVELATLPRMADFARVLAALDVGCPELTGGKALALFAGQRQRIAEDVVEGDAVGMAVQRLVDAEGTWAGAAGELLAKLTPTPAPKGWPRTPRALSGHLRRLRPALLGAGIRYDPPDPKNKVRTHRVEKTCKRPPEPPGPPETRIDDCSTGLFSSGGAAARPPEPPADRPTENPAGGAVVASVGGVGGMGGTAPAFSANERERGEI